MIDFFLKWLTNNVNNFFFCSILFEERLQRLTDGIEFLNMIARVENSTEDTAELTLDDLAVKEVTSRDVGEYHTSSGTNSEHVDAIEMSNIIGCSIDNHLISSSEKDYKVNSSNGCVNKTSKTLEKKFPKAVLSLLRFQHSKSNMSSSRFLSLNKQFKIMSLFLLS